LEVEERERLTVQAVESESLQAARRAFALIWRFALGKIVWVEVSKVYLYLKEMVFEEP
jgi:hypothetical protein